jgi:hypothetical protein
VLITATEYAFSGGGGGDGGGGGGGGGCGGKGGGCLPLRLFLPEFRCIVDALPLAMRVGDADMIAECIDSLNMLGFANSSSLSFTSSSSSSSILSSSSSSPSSSSSSSSLSSSSSSSLSSLSHQIPNATELHRANALRNEAIETLLALQNKKTGAWSSRPAGHRNDSNGDEGGGEDRFAHHATFVALWALVPLLYCQNGAQRRLSTAHEYSYEQLPPAFRSCPGSGACVDVDNDADADDDNDGEGDDDGLDDDENDGDNNADSEAEADEDFDADALDAVKRHVNEMCTENTSLSSSQSTASSSSTCLSPLMLVLFERLAQHETYAAASARAPKGDKGDAAGKKGASPSLISTPTPTPTSTFLSPLVVSRSRYQ